MKLCLSLVALLAAAIVVPAAGATGASSSPACGDVVTTDVTLTESLKNCASGLVVGADNVTIDLNGYAIKGLGTAAGIGIDAADHTGITLKNGRITDFAEGIKLFNVSNSTIQDIVVRRTVTGIRVARTDNGSDSNEIVDNKVRESVDGIVVFGAALSRIAGNTLSDLSGIGISCRDTFSGDIEIEGNRSVRNNTGIRLFFCGASVAGNIANDNDGVGISRIRSNGPTLRNVVNDNVGTGISLDDSTGSIVANVTNRNGGHGLQIVDQNAENGPFYTVTGNTANRNFGLGITTNLVGVIDGGGNRARHNGDPLQCTGIACG
jgi:parallel beta-helix repeat protein